MIQDCVIAVSEIMMSISLIPMLMNNKKNRVCGVPLATSVPTSLSLLAMAICFATLCMPFATLITIITAWFWFVLLFQRLLFGDETDDIPKDEII